MEYSIKIDGYPQEAGWYLVYISVTTCGWRTRYYDPGKSTVPQGFYAKETPSYPGSISDYVDRYGSKSATHWRSLPDAPVGGQRKIKSEWRELELDPRYA